MDRSVLARKPMTELKDIASHLEMRGFQRLRKAELIDAIIETGTAGARGQQTLVTDEDVAPAADEPRQDEPRQDEPREDEPGQDEPGQDEARQDEARQDESRQDGVRDRDGQRGDGDDEDGDRTRRSRRDRRKRNRDRDDAPRGDDQQGRSEQGKGEQPRGGKGGRSDKDRGDQGKGQQQGKGGGTEPGEVRAGVLDILPEGYGFLRTTGYLPGERDVYVSQGQIRKQGLRRGDVVQGPIRQQRNNEKVPALHHVQRVNGEPLADGQVAERPAFDDLPVTAVTQRLDLLAGEPSTTARLVDLIAPLGRGQRALLLTPPNAPTTQVLVELGHAVADADPDVHLMMVMIDERPEAIAAATESLDGEVIASTFDQTAEEHAQIAELAVERARRMVELGLDVVVLLDSATRLGRAHGVSAPGGGRAIAPGIDAAALYPLKRVMGAARAVDGGGSLTMLAVALTDTGSPVDDVLLTELRRTANAEIALDPALVRRRVHPPISITGSGTLEEEALQDPEELATVLKLRRALEDLSPAAATALVLDKLEQTDDKAAFLAQVQQADIRSS